MLEDITSKTLAQCRYLTNTSTALESKTDFHFPVYFDITSFDNDECLKTAYRFLSKARPFVCIFLSLISNTAKIMQWVRSKMNHPAVKNLF